jgi:hypothetical protein
VCGTEMAFRHHCASFNGMKLKGRGEPLLSELLLSQSRAEAAESKKKQTARLRPLDVRSLIKVETGPILGDCPCSNTNFKC